MLTRSEQSTELRIAGKRGPASVCSADVCVRISVLENQAFGLENMILSFLLPCLPCCEISNAKLSQDLFGSFPREAHW